MGLPIIGESSSSITPTARTRPPAKSSTSVAPGTRASATAARATSSSGLMTRSMLRELLSMMPLAPR